MRQRRRRRRTAARSRPARVAELLAQTGERDFEEAFVQAGVRRPSAPAPERRREASRSCAVLGRCYRKELIDALRDRRTLLTVLVSSVLMGPLVLLAISALVASLESRAEQREVYVAGIDHAPTLRNYLERQTYTVKAAPADFEARLRTLDARRSGGRRAGRFRGGAGARRRAGASRSSPTAPTSAREASAARIERLLGGFSRERALLSLALRGVSAQLLEPMQVEDRDLASTQTRATQHHRHAAVTS